MKKSHKILGMTVLMLVFIAIAFVFGQYTNRMTTYRSKVVKLFSAKQRVVVVINPKSVNKKSISFKTGTVVLDDTVIDLSGGNVAYVRVYINGNIQ